MADLIVLKFDTSHGATRALAAVRALEELRYAWFGGLLGLLLFWWFPPAWFFGGWLAGLGIGALVGETMAHTGLDKKMIDEIRSELTAGTSALLLIGAGGDADEMKRAFDPYKPTQVLRYDLSDDVVQKLKEALGTGTDAPTAP